MEFWMIFPQYLHNHLKDFDETCSEVRKNGCKGLCGCDGLHLRGSALGSSPGWVSPSLIVRHNPLAFIFLTTILYFILVSKFVEHQKIHHVL